MRHSHSSAIVTSGLTTPVADDVLLTPKQVAAMLGLRDSTLTNWRALYGQTQLPFIKLNFREVRYRRSVVLAFIAEREASTPDRMGWPTTRRQERQPTAQPTAGPNVGVDNANTASTDLPPSPRGTWRERLRAKREGAA